MGDENSPDLQAWVGRSEERQDVIQSERCVALQAALNLPDERLSDGDPLPPLWHWLYFWDIAPRSELGRDGHPAVGGFMPPVGRARRMWAGSRVSFPGTLRLGEPATRVSTIEKVAEKSGRSGKLVFVTVRHEVSGSEGLAVVDAHDIVYREDTGKGASARPGEPAPEGAKWAETVDPDPTLLFRYSALTFNGHRIHYDRDYARDVEGYDGLVVHGPLLATMMVGMAARSVPERPVSHFEFRGMRPVMDTETFTVNVDPDGADAVDVWVANGDGMYAMRGRTEFA
ncbi:MAG: MaoC family dehydratase N-terminal domain-containing protein [Alphaproteobacteria bacterium]|jgi:3-methylfumaryl-CoA hydratase